MKDSLLRVSKMGVPLRGSTKKNPRRDSKPNANPNSEDADVYFTASHQISTIADDLSATSSSSIVTTAGDLDEVGSNSPVLPLALDNSDNPSGGPEISLPSSVEHNEAITSTALDLLVEEIVGGGGCYTEEISTGSSNAAKGLEKDEGEGKMEAAMVGFSNAAEKLRGAIIEMMMSAIEQRKRNGGDVVFFSFSRLGETALACFVSAVLVSVFVAAVAKKPEGCWNNFSEYNGPSPT
ncbi:hypothetical protein KSP40_PGU004177 [Platanthera guangdongensis]|uniref:Uncharacterized protein n=1 Tax=Platanthera guangdongensis TaxID=2320717 RepID=A0ABR2MF17_9ASPA